MSLEIRKLAESDQEWVCKVSSQRWGSDRVVTRGKVHRVDTLSGFLAWVEGDPQGLVTYRIEQGECEIVTLDSLHEGQGIGTALLNAVKQHAHALGCARIWLITTNDNTPALRFYQRRGFQIVAVYHDAVHASRQIKPQIPERGIDNIPIRDEIELEISRP